MRTGTVIANQNIKECLSLKNIISTNYYSAEISEDITWSRVIRSN
jgi:glycerol-3-phosphate dehydrogenase (NAD(P)+)